jgi:hypothetical protein
MDIQRIEVVCQIESAHPEIATCICAGKEYLEIRESAERNFGQPRRFALSLRGYTSVASNWLMEIASNELKELARDMPTIFRVAPR